MMRILLTVASFYPAYSNYRVTFFLDYSKIIKSFRYKDNLTLIDLKRF